MALEAPVGFDGLEDELSIVKPLPATVGSSFLTPQTKEIACRFLEQYFQIFDSNNRQNLKSSYHDQAVFSLTICFNKGISKWAEIPRPFYTLSRNLKRLNNASIRERLLKVGKVNIISALETLPVTTHDPAAFTVDVTFASDALMNFTVHGLFKEANAKSEKPDIFHCSHHFVTVPQGQGIVVLNEQMCISRATRVQSDSAFRNPAPTPSSSAVQNNAVPVLPAAVASSAVAVPGADQALKEQMVAEFSRQSNMNVEWSSKCLLENDWAYEKAAAMFLDLHNQGKIPPEAFIKMWSLDCALRIDRHPLMCNVYRPTLTMHW